MNVSVLSMPYFVGIVVSKEIGATIDFCHYCYFSNYSFKFQPNVCNRCHDLLMMSMNLNGIAILNIRGSDYRCIITKNIMIKNP